MFPVNNLAMLLNYLVSGFQLVSIAEYQAHQIQMNLPTNCMSDDESDAEEQDLTYSVGMIYYAKVGVQKRVSFGFVFVRNKEAVLGARLILKV